MYLSFIRNVHKKTPAVSQKTDPPDSRLNFFPGGHNIKRLMAETGVQVTSHPDDVGAWTIFAPNK
jgi:hypothetical protein